MSKHSYDVAGIRAALKRGSDDIAARHTLQDHRYEKASTGRIARSVTTKLGFANKEYLARWYAKCAVERIKGSVGEIVAGDLSVFESSERAGEEIRDASAEIGTRAHAAIESFLGDWIGRGSPSPSGAESFLGEGSGGEEIAACRSFNKLIEDYEIIPLASETVVFEEFPKGVVVAGSVDFIGYVLTVYKDREGKEDCQHDYAPQKGRKLWCQLCGRETTWKLVVGDWKTSNRIAGNRSYALQAEAYARALEKKLGTKFDDLWVIRLDKYRAEYEIQRVTDRKAAWAEFQSIAIADELRSSGPMDLLQPLISKETIRI